MISLQAVTKSFDDKKVLADVSLSLNRGEVVALVGDNGAGKTTLLKIILGEMVPDNGQAINDHEIIGYLPQESPLAETIEASFADDTALWQIDRALAVTGLADKDLTTTVASLSGGQKTRLALARVLAHDPEPTVLLLDEPTNNIDLEGRRWLTEFIQSFAGGVLLVSHDRAFINQVATKVVELHQGALRQYGGNYDFYRAQKQLERENEQQHYEESVAEKKRLEKARQDKVGLMTDTTRESFDKIKHESKGFFNAKRNSAERGLGKQISALDSRLSQLAELERPEKLANLKLTIDGDVPSPKLIIRASELSGAYGQLLFKDLDLEIRGGERVQIVGPNGSGKTTLLKMLSGLLAPDSGAVTVGVGVKVGYYSQETLVAQNRTGLADLQAVTADRNEIYRRAKSLGLNIEDLGKDLAELSRGQLAKLAFAKIILEANNLLILDEPTNHLDIASRERIEAALQNYHGAILVASHDEYFLEQINVTRQIDLAKFN